jgi:hypothetical protein
MNVYDVRVPCDLTKPNRRSLVASIPFKSLMAKEYIVNKSLNINDGSGNPISVPVPIDHKSVDIINNIADSFKIDVTVGGVGVGLNKTTRTVSSIDFVSGSVNIPMDLTVTSNQVKAAIYTPAKYSIVRYLLQDSPLVDASGNKYVYYRLVTKLGSGQVYTSNSYILKQNNRTLVTLDFNINDTSGNTFRSSIYNGLSTAYSTSTLMNPTSLSQYPRNFLFKLTDSNRTNAMTYTGNTRALSQLGPDSSGVSYYAQNHDVCMGFGLLDISSYNINLSSFRYTCVFFDALFTNDQAKINNYWQYITVSLTDSRSTEFPNWNTSLFAGSTGSIGAGTGINIQTLYSSGSVRSQNSSGTVATSGGAPIEFRDPDINTYDPPVFGNFCYDYLSSNYAAPGTLDASGGYPFAILGLICDSTDDLMYLVVKNTRPNNNNVAVPWYTVSQQALGLRGVLRGILTTNASSYIGNFRYFQTN